MTSKQITLASEVDVGLALHRTATSRNVFLAKMGEVVPWSALRMKTPTEAYALAA